MDYLEHLKSIDTLYYVSENPIDFTDINNNHPYTDDFGEGIYLFANKWLAIADAEYKFAKLYPASQRIFKNFHVYSYDFKKSQIDMSKLSSKAWGYKADLKGHWAADDFTRKDWSMFVEKKQYSPIDHLVCAPAGFYQYRYFNNDTRATFNGYAMSTRYLEFCFKSTESLKLLSYEKWINVFSFAQHIRLSMKIWKVLELDLCRPLVCEVRKMLHL